MGRILVAFCLLVAVSPASAQTLNDLAALWLAQAGKTPTQGDYTTGQPEGGADAIQTWNTKNLGPQPTAQQLQALVSAWQARQSARTAAAAALRAGIQIASTGSPALNGVYALTDSAKALIDGVYAGIRGGDGLPGGGSTFVYFDASGVGHGFDATAFTNFAKAVRDYLYALSQGQTPALPVTIP